MDETRSVHHGLSSPSPPSSNSRDFLNFPSLVAGYVRIFTSLGKALQIPLDLDTCEKNWNCSSVSRSATVDKERETVSVATEQEET